MAGRNIESVDSMSHAYTYSFFVIVIIISIYKYGRMKWSTMKWDLLRIKRPTIGDMHSNSS